MSKAITEQDNVMVCGSTGRGKTVCCAPCRYGQVRSCGITADAPFPATQAVKKLEGDHE